MEDTSKLKELAKLIRYYILKMTTEAGSGHPTSSLSATDLMTALFFGKLRFDLKNPRNPNNDRVVFSKGHASPLIYALYAAAGEIDEKELASYRRFKSVLEGHPTFRFKFAEAATGSLGQGLSVGAGMAVALRSERIVGPVSSFLPASAPQPFSSGIDNPTNSKLKSEKGRVRAVGSPSTTATHNSPIRDTRGTLDSRDTLPKIYVLMGDSEIAEGSVWEACELASYYKLGNLVAIVDVNRLGQSGETMIGWNLDIYTARFEAFGWDVKVVDGHDYEGIMRVYEGLEGGGDKPVAIIAKTLKGKGVSFLEDKEGWHGKALSPEEFEKAIVELGNVDRSIRGVIKKPEGENSNYQFPNSKNPEQKLKVEYKVGDEVATRKAFGETLAKLGEADERIVSLDAEVKNSTFSEKFMEKFPNRFFECFVAEQNMVGMATGMSRLGMVPFVSTFAAFFTRAFDQIRMSPLSGANIKFVGSHSGVSIGEDGPSQMGLEDISMFKSVFGSVVICPSDAVSCARITQLALLTEGIFYIRTARPATPVIYKNSEEFIVGGSKVLRSTDRDELTIAACGVTVHEALRASDELAKAGIKVGVIDCYSIKPIDGQTLREAAKRSNKTIITVEDHYFEGGLGDSVLNVFSGGGVRIIKLAVSKLPMSGKGGELLDYEGISGDAIIKKVKEITSERKN